MDVPGLILRDDQQEGPRQGELMEAWWRVRKDREVC